MEKTLIIISNETDPNLLKLQFDIILKHVLPIYISQLNYTELVMPIITTPEDLRKYYRPGTTQIICTTVQYSVTGYPVEIVTAIKYEQVKILNLWK